MGFKTVTLLVAGIFAFGEISIRAQDAGALLDLLVRKKLITDQEAEGVRAELTKESTSTPAGKWKLSTPITELELYGDARVRYEIRSGETENEDTLQRNLPRYRLRLGLRGILADDWFFGVRLETGTNPRSSNVTFGDDSGGGNGPFAKNSDGVFVGQAYLGYKGFKDITLTVGKMPNPMISTLMVWDPDINPEGLAEQWKHTFTIALGDGAEEPETSYSKDGTALPGPKKKKPEARALKIEVFANFGQFVYDDANPENPLGGRSTTTANGGRQLIPNTDAFLLAWQVGAAIGQLKKKGEWQFNVFYQRQDQFALDPNLVDTEIWDTKLNLEGVALTFGYMLSDAVWVQLLYGYAWRADDSLGTGGDGAIGINPLKNFQLFQLDLNVKV